MVRIGEEEGLRGGETMLHDSASTGARAWYYFCKDKIDNLVLKFLL